MALLGLRFCPRAFSSCGKRGPLFITVHGPLTIAASLVAEHRLQMHRLSNCGSRAQPLRGMWAFPRPGLEPVSPALAGRFSTTGVAILISDKIDFKIKTITRDKEGCLHNDQGINPRRRYNNCKYLCTQHRSTSIHKANANSHKRGN